MRYAILSALFIFGMLVSACSKNEPSVPAVVKAFSIEGAAGEIEIPAAEVKYQKPVIDQPITKSVAKEIKDRKHPKLHKHSKAPVAANGCETTEKSCQCPAHKEIVSSLLPDDAELSQEAVRIPAMQFSTVTLRTPGKPIFEYGITAGFPAVANLYLTTWGTAEMPWMFRISGMYLGNFAQGIQLETGWAFYRTDQVRQYVGLEFLTLEWNPNVGILNHTFSRFNATGIGPTYGITAFGVTAQVGIYYGNYRLNFQNRMEGFNVSAQLGWANLW